jgi:hypothetical protein
MTSEASPDNSAVGLDRVTRAIAEARARQYGLSLSDYVAQLILASGGQSGLRENLHVGPRVRSLSSDPTTQPGFWDEVEGERADNPFFSRDIVKQWSNFVAEKPGWTLSPALALVALFNERIQAASLLMSAAFLEAAVADFKGSPAPHGSGRRRSWYEQVISTCLVRSKEVRNALVHKWQPTERAERLAIDAFVLLSDLTPARMELLRLCRYDRPRAFSELAKHLDLVTEQFRLSAQLLAELEAGDPAALAGDRRFPEASASLLEKAGGGISLTEGAELLGTTRQALHKRIKSGSALGMMHGTELVLPRVQFVTAGKRTHLVEGLSQVVKLFDEAQAGRWSALQFLVEHDPNLGEAPIRSLSEGPAETVVNAARAYLGLDED